MSSERSGHHYRQYLTLERLHELDLYSRGCGLRLYRARRRCAFFELIEIRFYGKYDNDYFNSIGTLDEGVAARGEIYRRLVKDLITTMPKTDTFT